MRPAHWASGVEQPTASPKTAASAARDAELLDERRLRMVVEHSAALRWQMTSIMVVIAAVAMTGVAPAWVLVWLTVVICTREVRAAALLRMVRETTVPIAVRLKHTALWTLALGISIGSASLFMLRLDTAFDAVLTMILMSLSAGAVSTTAMMHRAFVAFAAALCLPTALMWFLSEGWLGWSVGGMALMFFGVQLRFARQSAHTFEESFNIRLENVELLRQLTEERTLIGIARDAAVQANQSKSRFLAAASHDLRQPLQSLSLNSGALSRMQLEGDSRQIAMEIGQGIDALRQMLDALLDISTLDAGGVIPNFQQVPLDRLLEAVCAGFRPAASAKGLRLECHCPSGCVVTSDAEMLRRVVSNLIDNAIKFTSQGGVTLTAAQRGDRVRLAVSDSGCGIQSADQNRVFEDLTQLGNPQRNRAFGHGLGLGIVRRLNHMLGIEHGISSSVGVGTQFHLDIPSGHRGAAVSDATTNPQPGLISRRVLVLEDDAAVRTAYGNALRSLGCQVTCSATLVDALAHAAICDPEVALIDYRLADKENGLDAVRRLRALRPSLAAVMVSADMTPELHEAATREGVPLLRKPVTDAALAAAITDAQRSLPAARGPALQPNSGD
jgi:signal transduction histidine kinase/ActR/RegA family two-component response regulator